MLSYRVLLRALKERLGDIPSVTTDMSPEGRASRVMRDIFAGRDEAKVASFDDYEYCGRYAEEGRPVFLPASYARCALASFCLRRVLKLSNGGTGEHAARLLIADCPHYATEVSAPLVAFLLDVHGAASSWTFKQSVGLAASVVSVHLARNVMARHLFEAAGANAVGEALRWPHGWFDTGLSRDAVRGIEFGVFDSLAGIQAFAGMLLARARATTDPPKSPGN